MRLLLSLMVLVNISYAYVENSVLCRAEDMISVESINCCTSELNLNQCGELVSLLPEWIIARTHEVKGIISEGEVYTPGVVPNCYWNAVSFLFPDLIETKLLTSNKYWNILEENFIQISKEEASYGDMVLFYGHWMERMLKDDGITKPRMVWVQKEGPLHAMIYLGEGFIFQKENASSSIFSIGSLDFAQYRYDKSMEAGPTVRKVTLDIRFFRAK